MTFIDLAVNTIVNFFVSDARSRGAKVDEQAKEKVQTLIRSVMKAKDHPCFIDEMGPVFEQITEISERLSRELEKKEGVKT